MNTVDKPSARLRAASRRLRESDGPFTPLGKEFEETQDAYVYRGRRGVARMFEDVAVWYDRPILRRLLPPERRRDHENVLSIADHLFDPR